MESIIEFSLDILDDTDDTLGPVKAALARLGCRFDVHRIAGGSGIEVTIWAPDEKTAFDAVDVVYGHDDGSRDSNRFYVYGEA